MSHILFIAGLVKYYTLHAILTFSQHVLQHLPYLCHKNPNHYDIPRILCQKHHSGYALDTQLLYSETDLQVLLAGINGIAWGNGKSLALPWPPWEFAMERIFNQAILKS